MFALIFILTGLLVQNSATSAHTNHSYVRIPRQTVAKGCYLPPHPTNGEWTIYEANMKFSTGHLVKAQTVLRFSCQNDYKLDGVEFATCINREWKPSLARCRKVCPTISDSFVMTVSCTYHEKPTKCVDALEGTIARFQCSRFYEDRRLESHPFRICSNGSWGSLPECAPVCGKKFGEEPTLIVGGSKSERGEYPWQIALYTATDKILICGGTLLNQRVILTAAHCITDIDGNLLDKNLYLVAAGKYFRQFDDPRDANETQFSSISQMFSAQQYKGDLQNYLGDIAILITEKPFVLSNNVQPVCMDWGFSHYKAELSAGNLAYGYVAGWGFTVEYKTPSSVLKALQVPLVTDKQCIQKLADDDKKYLTDDKICAGFLNSNTSVCRGDSGGGLVYESGGRFYLMGVVSLSPQANTRIGGCDSQQYGLYTNVSHYVDGFILEIETKYRNSGLGNMQCNQDSTCTTTTEVFPEERNCVLPPLPQFGRWSFFQSEDFYPGMLIEPGTILEITCMKGYKLDSNETLVCDSGKWSSEIGHCLKTCPSIESSNRMNVTCTRNNKEEANCMEAINGTVVRFQCAPFHEDLTLKTRSFRVCRDGVWDQNLPHCRQVCGQKYNNGSTLATGNYPWHVGIYSTSDKQLICSGSLLAENIVLTAAHCITNGTRSVLPKENYVVAIGKKYKLFNDSRDTNDAHFSELREMLISSDFQLIEDHYNGDIGMLVLQTPFTLSEKVLPVCLDLAERVVSASQGYKGIGEMPGWRPTSSSSSSDVLKKVEISESRCEDADAQEVKNVQTFDQRCVGTVDKGPSICKGDDGSGVVYEQRSRYYIRGVVSFPESLQPSNGCDNRLYALYTKTYNYLGKFILAKMSKHRI